MKKIHDLGHGFWNIRGDLRLFGVLNIGTQASLIRLRSGRFVMLDSCALSDAARSHLLALTDNGSAVEAILNLHPFHTLHCASMAATFPDALLYGSVRHMRVHPGLNWQEQPVESPEVAARYSADLDFSMPRGIDYISEDERVHAGSLLVRHRTSGTLHVDDTLNVLPLPQMLITAFGLPQLTFHPATMRALQTDRDAVRNFRDWVQQIRRDWADTRVICAAHSRILELPEDGFALALDRAMARLETGLEKAKIARGG